VLAAPGCEAEASTSIFRGSLSDPSQEALQRCLERPRSQRPRQGRQRLQRGPIQRIYKRFPTRNGRVPNLHPHPYSSKFPTLTLQGGQQFGASLPHDCSNGAGVGGKLQLPVPFLRNTNPEGQRTRQMPANDSRQCFLALATSGPTGQRRVGAEDALKGLRGTDHGGRRPQSTEAALRRNSWEEPH